MSGIHSLNARPATAEEVAAFWRSVNLITNPELLGEEDVPETAKPGKYAQLLPAGRHFTHPRGLWKDPGPKLG